MGTSESVTILVFFQNLKPTYRVNPMAMSRQAVMKVLVLQLSDSGGLATMKVFVGGTGGCVL
jgi:hypothetical protein